ncbi:MAG: SGNH/GDSL hydrolase family protein, partial [Candidatus Binatia bacterium]
MERTVLFFGDSITRGYGVGRERCFATLVADELGARSASSWKFEVVTGWSSFPSYRQRLQPGLKRVQPEILVLQCPSGPACYFPRFPAPVRGYMRIQKRLLAWLTGRYVQSEIRREPAGGRTSYDALYDGRFLDRLHGWRPSHWPVVGPWWRRRAETYPPIPKVSREGYLKRIQHLVDDARAHGVRETVLIGLLPMTEDVCPGYLARARQWCAALG